MIILITRDRILWHLKNGIYGTKNYAFMARKNSHLLASMAFIFFKYGRYGFYLALMAFILADMACIMSNVNLKLGSLFLRALLREHWILKFWFINSVLTFN